MSLSIKAYKRIVFVLALLPLVIFFAQLFRTGGGPDPGKDLVLFTGEWTIRFLLLTLAITPLRRWFKWHRLGMFRRMLGLYTGFYATLHFLAVMTYFVGWNWSRFVEEFQDRPYMSVGIIAWVMLIPLIITSNRWAIRQMGPRWQTLHRLVYPIVILGCIHVVWLVRANYAEALFYAATAAILLVTRLLHLQRAA